LYHFLSGNNTNIPQKRREVYEGIFLFKSALTPPKTPPKSLNHRKKATIFTKTAPTPHFQHHPNGPAGRCLTALVAVFDTSAFSCFILFRLIFGQIGASY